MVGRVTAGTAAVHGALVHMHPQASSQDCAPGDPSSASVFKVGPQQQDAKALTAPKSSSILKRSDTASITQQAFQEVENKLAHSSEMTMLPV